MSHTITLKEIDGPVVTATFRPPLEARSGQSDFDLGNEFSLTMFIMSLNLSGLIPALAQEIEAEQTPLADNIIKVDFRQQGEQGAVTEMGSSENRTLSLKEIVRRSMRELDLNNPTQYVQIIVIALIAIFKSQEATVVTY